MNDTTLLDICADASASQDNNGTAPIADTITNANNGTPVIGDVIPQ